MREWERSLTPENTRYRHGNRFGPRQSGALEADHFKVRRGKVGAFRTAMSPELRRYVASLPHTARLLERLAARTPSHLTSVPRAGSGPPRAS